MIDFEREGSGEFSDLYVRLLRAALDETNCSLSPQMRERGLTAHVMREISTTCSAHESQRSRIAFHRGPGNGKTPFL
jgi:hypothetical protein